MILLLKDNWKKSKSEVLIMKRKGKKSGGRKIKAIKMPPIKTSRKKGSGGKKMKKGY